MSQHLSFKDVLCPSCFPTLSPGCSHVGMHTGRMIFILPVFPYHCWLLLVRRCETEHLIYSASKSDTQASTCVRLDAFVEDMQSKSELIFRVDIWKQYHEGFRLDQSEGFALPDEEPGKIEFEGVPNAKK